jgi:hypothetical protein
MVIIILAFLVHKIVRDALITNLTIAVLFVLSNASLWSQINGNGHSLIVASYWNPLTVMASHYGYAVNGELVAGLGIFHYYNMPFWIFFVVIVVNLYFIYKLSKNQSIIIN